MKLWIVRLPSATPPLVITDSEAQRDAWIEQGAATAVYEVDALEDAPAD